MYIQDKICNFDVFLERQIYMNYPNYLFNQRTCDYYNELCHAQDLFVPFDKNVYHYVSKYFSKFQFTLCDEKIMYDAIYLYASKLMREFFDIIYVFFYEFLKFLISLTEVIVWKLISWKRNLDLMITVHLGWHCKFMVCNSLLRFKSHLIDIAFDCQDVYKKNHYENGKAYLK